MVDGHQDRADATKQQIESEGGQAATVVTDLSDEASCQNIVDKALEVFGRVDILVPPRRACTG